MVDYEATIVGAVSAKIGESAVDCETISNLKRAIWDRVLTSGQRHTPRFAMNTVPPLGWHRPHKYAICDLHCTKTAYHAFYHNGSGNKAYIVEDGDNPEVPYFEVTVKDENGKEWKATFTGTIVDKVSEGVSDGEDMLIVYYLSAKKVVVTPPP